MKQKVKINAARMAPQKVKTKHRKRARKGKNILYYIMFAFIAIATGIILSLTVFFKIELIEVEGTDRYQSSAVISSSGVRLGDNTFRVSGGNVKTALLTQYPYIEDAKIRRSLPAKLTIEVTQAIPLGAFTRAQGYILISTTGRVLELGTGKCPPEYFQVSGVVIENLLPGQYLTSTNNDEFTMLKYLTHAVEATGFDKITRIDLSNRLSIILEYDNRLLIDLGSEGELENKLEFAYYAIQNTLRPDFEGFMDVTIPKQVRTMPGEIHAEGYHGEGDMPIGTVPINPIKSKPSEGGDGIQSGSSLPESLSNQDSSSSQSSSAASESSH